MYNFKQILSYKTAAELQQFLLVKKNRPTLGDLYHASAYLAKLPLYKKEGSDLISVSRSVKYWNTNDMELAGIIKLFTHPSRSKILTGSATASEGNLRFSALTPLVLAAFKEYKDIPYSAWDWTDEGIEWILDPSIKELLPYINDHSKIPAIDADSAVQIMSEISSDPITIWSPNHPDIKKYPRLLRVILLQSWVAYPLVRNKYMLLDLENLDNIPESIYGDLNIVNTSPFMQFDPNLTKSDAESVNPWG